MSAPRKRGASRAVCTSREGPGKPGEIWVVSRQRPSNSYFEGRCSLCW